VAAIPAALAGAVDWSEGKLAGGCLTCPWHGSVFRVTDGAVLHGPATAPQPVFQVRMTGGVIQVCLPGAG
jgi:nitrite reductase/ring-hydroxylating ferredoxin subunit